MVPDQLSTKTIALPAAGATANTASIDLGFVTPGSLPALEAQLSVPATPSLVDAKTIIYYLEDSPDNATFTRRGIFGTQLGAGGAGAAAAVYRLSLPPDVKRYLRGSADVLAAGGSNIAVSFTFRLAA